MASIKALLTRPADSALLWCREMEQHGILAAALPLIAIHPLQSAPHQQALRQWHDQLHALQALMFVSPSAVTHFWNDAALREWHALHRAADGHAPRLWAPGPGTANALRQLGLPAHCIDLPAADARQFESETLWPVVEQQVRQGAQFLMVRGTDEIPHPQHHSGDTNASMLHGQGRHWLAAQIEAHGARAHFIAAYQRGLPTWGDAEYALAESRRKDGTVWIFSSSQALQNLAHLLPATNWQTTPAVATHPRIAIKARELGFHPVVESQPQPAALAASLKFHFLQ